MKRDDIEKLLGAYATGTLSAEERAALYDAALADQSLFGALMREEPLRELFEDPVARARLIAVLSDSPKPKRSWWWQPAPWAVAGALATAGLVAFFVVAPRPPSSAPLPQMEAKLAPALAPAPPAPVAEKKVIARAPRREFRVEDAPKPVGIGGYPSAPAPVADAKAAFQETERTGRGAPAAVAAGRALPAARTEIASAISEPAHVQPRAALALGARRTLDYKVLRESEGEFVEAEAGAVFAASDVVRLAVIPPADGLLAIQSEPNAEAHNFPARKGERVVVPPTGGIKLGPGAGSKTVRLVFVAEESKGMADKLELRHTRAKEVSNTFYAPASITVDVVLKFR